MDQKLDRMMEILRKWITKVQEDQELELFEDQGMCNVDNDETEFQASVGITTEVKMLEEDLERHVS